MSAPTLERSRYNPLRGYVTAFRGDLHSDSLAHRENQHRSQLGECAEPTPTLLQRVLEGLRQL